MPNMCMKIDVFSALPPELRNPLKAPRQDLNLRPLYSNIDNRFSFSQASNLWLYQTCCRIRKCGLNIINATCIYSELVAIIKFNQSSTKLTVERVVEVDSKFTLGLESLCKLTRPCGGRVWIRTK